MGRFLVGVQGNNKLSASAQVTFAGDEVMQTIGLIGTDIKFVYWNIEPGLLG